MSVIHEGEILHIITRRNFDNDARRHFVGRVLEEKKGLVRIEGFAFVYHSGNDRFHKHPERRVRVFDVGHSGHIVNVLPDELDIDRIHYGFDENRHLVITDGDGFELDINEFGLTT
ncbi:MAG: hypothetical protein ACQGVK_26225 [Myxococcota bacterium]